MSETETIEKNEAADTKSGFEASIGAAVEAAVEANKKSKEDGGSDARLGESAEDQQEAEVQKAEVQDGPDTDLKTNLSSDDDEPEQDDELPVTEGADDDDPTPSEGIPDDLLERAVRAGMKMSTARKFPDADALEEAINLVSHTDKSKTDTGKEPADEPKGSEVDELLGQIKDLNPDEYDEELVNNMSVLKSLVSKLAKDNEALRTQSATSGFEAQINTLDESVAKLVRSNPDKQSLLKRKFDAIKAGYQAIGESVTESEAFKEASNLVLADDIAKASQASKAKSAQKRSSQRIARPSGKNVERAKSAEEEAVELLKSKFNL